jgi:hypothetical protein
VCEFISCLNLYPATCALALVARKVVMCMHTKGKHLPCAALHVIAVCSDAVGIYCCSYSVAGCMATLSGGGTCCTWEIPHNTCLILVKNRFSADLYANELW